MEFKFGKDKADEGAPAQPQEKSKQTGLLVLLLILLGGFGYLYFFTGLIRPQEAPPAPPPPPQVVKQPLPSRDAAVPAAAKPADQKAAAPSSAPVPAAQPAVKPPPKTADAKPAVAPAAKQEPAKPVAPVAKQPEPVKPAVPSTVKTEPKKAVPPPAKVEEKKSAIAAAPTAKPVETVKKQPAVSKTQGPWTVVVGLYVVEETLAEDMAKMKKAGLTPVMTRGPRRPVTMHRLFYGDYTGKQEAQKAVETLKNTAGGGFSVQRGEKHEVFAGSYAVLSGAQSEQQRLAAAGIKVTVRKTQVPLASRKLTAGTFTDRKAAVEVQKKLKSAGIGSPEIE